MLPLQRLILDFKPLDPLSNIIYIDMHRGSSLLVIPGLTIYAIEASTGFRTVTTGPTRIPTPPPPPRPPLSLFLRTPHLKPLQHA